MKKLKYLNELIHQDFEDSAEAAGLRYVSTDYLCITRRKNGKGFIYYNGKDEKISNGKTLDRINSLVIPPAWQEVKICKTSNGHIQATGYDAKGRKQYIYHPKWDEVRSTNKFNTIIKFAESLPLIREKVSSDLRKHSLTKEKVTAVIIRLLEDTLIRIGNIEYAKANNSFGLTTLRNKHIKVEGSQINFIFSGKSGKQWKVDYKNKKLAKLVKQCQELPGQHLFQYIDDEGNRQPVDSYDVNEYLKNIVDYDFTAKDFRTWGGTVLAAIELYQSGKAENEKNEKKKIKEAIKSVASSLNNTITICKKYYIHPEIINSYKDGMLFTEMKKTERKLESDPDGLEKEEKAVLNILYKKANK